MATFPTDQPAIYTDATCYASVRRGFAESDVWGDTLQDWRRGLNVPLRVAVIDGPLDAPQIMPAGAMVNRQRGKTCKPGPQFCSRAG